MNSIIKYLSLATLFLSIMGCDEDSFVKTIDIEQADFPPKLAVTAILDTDSGRFTLSMKEAHSISYYKTYQSEQKNIIRNGTVNLYEDDVLRFSISGPFDLSVANYGKNGYHNEFTGVSAVAGRTYRLEIDIDGYDKATSTTVMPDAPIVSNISVDVEHPVKKEKVRHIESLSSAWGSSSYSGYQYMPVSLTISDNGVEPDFYSFHVEYYTASKYDGDDAEYEYTVSPGIATSNLILIQDNPDVESQDITMEGENVDLYSFDLMMFTDATFANTNVRLDLYSPYEQFYIPGDGDPYKPDQSSYVIRRYTLITKHYTREAFRQYRSMAFQLAGLGFFSEPVFITSNMENAYGGFSAQNTTKTVLFEAKYIIE
jgi:hypothetical protein